MEREVVGFAERVADAVAEVASLVAAYVHGSAALGGFVPGRSDVDLLFVVASCDDPLGLGGAIAAAAEPCPGRGLEATVLTVDQAAIHGPNPPFAVHVATGDGAPRIVDGTRHPGDRDLVMHVAVTLAAGVVVRGAAPVDVLREPSRGEVLGYLADELSAALDGPEPYAVLNACRAWRYLDDGAIVSKISGAAWAREQGAPTAIVGRALAAQMGLVESRRVTPDAASFVHAVRARLLGAG